MFKKLFLFLNTVRYLRLIQIFGRIIFQFYKPRLHVNKVVPALEEFQTEYIFLKKEQSFFPPKTFCFLNLSKEVNNANVWNLAGEEKLWLYNFHYFDDLNAKNSEERSVYHNDLMNKWIDENPSTKGNGWESYPLSLRIVNWIKWGLCGNEFSDQQLLSLFEQAQWLSRRIEFHLLGNHLIANAKALIFAGSLFKGDTAQKWLSKGIEVLVLQINEQVLDDGGHFERSPMYHAIVLEDLLDVINISFSFPGRIKDEALKKFQNSARKMISALNVMCHPDRDIAFFNDSAMNIASKPDDLIEYGRTLGLISVANEKFRTTGLPDTGYYSLHKKNIQLIVDAAPIGPDYLPAHAHADTLSFELSIGKQRLLVNSGTSCYGNSNERLRQRRTAAHNSLTIDSHDSSEVWSGFRVARRAKIVGRKIKILETKAMISASHDGFQRLKNVNLHQRTWELSQKELIITDSLTGSGVHFVCMYYHFHPELYLEMVQDKVVHIFDNEEKHLAVMNMDDSADISINDGTFHPEFGLSLQNQNISCKIKSEFPLTLITRFGFI